MRLIFLLGLVSFHALSNPLQIMNERLSTYAEINRVMCAPNGSNSDEGLFVDVSCDISCKNASPKVERAKGVFLPRELGLTPGNGSSDTNIVWGAVGVSLKLWSQKVCLERALETCKTITNVDNAQLKELESGKWKINRFPGCSEKSVTVSPFSDDAGSNRVLHQVASISKGMDVHKQEYGLQSQLPPGKFNLGESEKTFTASNCKNIIKAKLCFGDCIDLEKDGSDITETLGTPDPLGTDSVEMCADTLAEALKNVSVTSSIRAQLCETYFWESFMKLDHRMLKSCAALRGEVDCTNF